MKFSNGFWLTREGFKIHSPVEVSHTTENETGYTLLAPCHKRYHRENWFMVWEKDSLRS